jgi:hypothetical protein
VTDHPNTKPLDPQIGSKMRRGILTQEVRLAGPDGCHAKGIVCHYSSMHGT